MKKRWWMIPLAALLLLGLAFFAYTLRYYHADDAALGALESDNRVTVTKTDFGWFFDGPAADSALVFYTGGKVEEKAYAPLLRRLAENGVDVCLLKSPFHLAFFGMNRADQVLDEYDYENRYIGGHSLGGVVAAAYAANHDLDGVILLAAYPVRELDEPVLLIYGTEDGVLNRERVTEAGRYGRIEEAEIEGGNHAGFGSYGAQAGDHAPKISAERQQEETVTIITDWLSGLA